MTNMELDERIRLRIKQCREDKGYSFAELAELLSVSAPTVNRWETGNIKTIKMSHIMKLAGIFEVSPAYLMGQGDNPIDLNGTKMSRELPVLGRIPAGVPIEAIEHKTGNIEVPPGLVKRFGINNLFALKIQGESMNKEVASGSVGIFVKDDDAPSGSLVAVTINGDDATLKRLVKVDNYIILKPESTELGYDIKTIDLYNGQQFRILGRLIAAIKLF